MIRNYVPTVAALLILFQCYAQHSIEPCGFDQLKSQWKSQIGQSEKIIRSSAATKSKLSSHIKRIPVVVHVIHDGGTSNISDAQIQSQIDVLNEDYRKISGTNGDGNGVDTEIEFCLAKKDPLGRCTKGIIRINSPLSNHQTYQRSMLKQLSFWDNTRYLNIYVVKNINNGSGTLGYASFPGGPFDEDGIVVKHNYFGRIGTAAATLGRTTTHEAGHWLGLYHTFNNGCGTDTCADGDYVCDTPPALQPNYGCPAAVNSCANDFFPDQIANYMDYSNDNCKSMFSDGQKQRMQSTLNSLRYNIWQQWNIDSTGCDSGFVNGPCNVIADFVTMQPNICVGNTITFYNKSQNGATTWQWTFTGGTPATSTAANPTVTYSSLGTFPVKLVASDSSSSDSLELMGYITVSTPPLGQPLPYFEGFEADSFPPNGITIENADQGVTWERDTIALAYQGTGSARINNLINTNYGQSDAMLLPVFDLTGLGYTPYLNIKWAYARSDANYSDEMMVLVSKDCGATWSQVFYRTGTMLATGPTQTTPYIPDSNTVWKSGNISLLAYTSYSSVQIKIVNVTDGGNNLYIDNINLGPNTVVTEIAEETMNGFLLFPNPAHEQINVVLPESEKGEHEVVVCDILGSTIFRTRFTENTLKVDTHALSSGVYFISVNTNGRKFTRKLIVQ